MPFDKSNGNYDCDKCIGLMLRKMYECSETLCIFECCKCGYRREFVATAPHEEVKEKF